MRKLLVLLCLCLAMTCAFAEDEELSMDDILLDAAPEVEDTIVRPEEVPETTPEPISIYEPDGSVLITLTATGDMTLSGPVYEEEMARYNGDPAFVFKNIKQVLQADDLTILSLESAPATLLPLLKENGIDAAAIANEHVDALSPEAQQALRDDLALSGITAIGPKVPAVFEVKETQLAMLSYNCLGDADLSAALAQDIAAAKAQYPIVIVCFHWGQENTYTPDDQQMLLARLAVDSGADLVLGSHSRRIQPMEFYNGAYICYSLGNFSYASADKPSDMSALLLQARFRLKDGQVTADGIRIEPIRISSRTDKNDMIPSPMDKVTAVDSILGLLKENGRMLPDAVTEYPLAWDK